MQQIVWSYSPGYLIICLFVGIIYAYLLYRKEKSLSENGNRLIYVLAGFRVLSVFFISLFFLEPLLEQIETEKEKPIVVIAQDNSASILLSDSSDIQGVYRKTLEETIEKLAEKYDVRTYDFGRNVSENISFKFEDQESDISEVLNDFENRFYNQNVGAVILASDGIFNKGSNPLYTKFANSGTPIYSIALGDTTSRKDIWVDQVVHNKLAYLGNKFPVLAKIKTIGFVGEELVVRVRKKSKLLKEAILKVTQGEMLLEEQFLLEADAKGVQHYVVEIESIDGEFSVENNQFDFFIDVLDSRQKIVVLSASPHPDISAIKRALKTNKNYQVESRIIGDEEESLEEASLLILHGVPSLKQKKASLQRIMKSSVPKLFFVSQGTYLRKFNELNLGAQISSFNGRTESYKLWIDSDFEAFHLSDETRNSLNDFPPLLSPFGKIQIDKKSAILFHQRLGNIRKEDPLVVFSQVDNSKTGIVFGEGVWRWRLSNYLTSNEHKAFDEWLQKTVQYLVSREDKSRFRIVTEHTYFENQSVKFKAEVYDKTYAITTGQEIKMSLTNEEGESVEYQFLPSDNGYQLDVGKLKIGTYSYNASVVLDGKKQIEKGTIIILPLHLEATENRANHQLLYSLASKTGGKLIHSNELDQLVSELDQNDNVVTITYEKKSYDDLLEQKWLFFLILLFLSVEWFIRKYKGAY